MTKFPALEVGGAMAESCYVCLASLLPCAAFTVAGVTSAYVTGPAAVLSVLLVAFVVCLTGNSQMPAGVAPPRNLVQFNTGITLRPFLQQGCHQLGLRFLAM